MLEQNLNFILKLCSIFQKNLMVILNHMTVFKLSVLDRNTGNHTTVCKLFLLNRNGL